MSNNFKLGNRVIVFQNSERIPTHSYIGKTGIVIGTKSKDVVVQFDDNKIGYIWDKDLNIV